MIIKMMSRLKQNYKNIFFSEKKFNSAQGILEGGTSWTCQLNVRYIFQNLKKYLCKTLQETHNQNKQTLFKYLCHTLVKCRWI